MGVRGASELLEQLPGAAAASADALEQAVEELLALRLAPLSGEQVRAAGEFFERVMSRVAAGRLAVLAAIDDRDDVIPRARPGQSSVTFQQHVLGATRTRSRRDAHAAALLRPALGDLRAVGAAYAAGEITGGHVEVAVRAHKDLGDAARETLVPAGELTDMTPTAPTAPAASGDLQDLGDPGEEALRSALAALADAGGVGGGLAAGVRQVLVVDTVLAHYARLLSVPELDAVARRIVATLNPPSPSAAHEQRYLHMSQLPDGAWVGKFSCGPAQGALLKAALAAFSAPRPGLAVDGDGVQRVLPDTRDHGARQMDALTELVALAAARHGIHLSPAPDTGPGGDDQRATSAPVPADPGLHGDRATDTIADHAPRDPNGDNRSAGRSAGQHDPPGGDRSAGQGCPSGDDASTEGGHPPGDHQGPGERPEDDARTDRPGLAEEPPVPEGEYQVIRAAGVPHGPAPDIELIVVVGIDHLAGVAALDQAGELPLGLDDDIRQRLARWLHRVQSPAQTEAFAPSAPPPGWQRATGGESAEQLTAAHHPRHDCTHAGADGNGRAGEGTDGNVCAPEPAVMSAVRRGWSPFAAPARVEHAGPVDDHTLRLLACNAVLRAVTLAPNGAVLDLGRAQRLASPAQKLALRARDGGCVIPGCTVPGDACDAHHIVYWADGGPTDIDNLALLCDRHHTETHQSTWDIVMTNGVPWVRLPSWLDRTRPLLRNAVHRPPQRHDLKDES